MTEKTKSLHNDKKQGVKLCFFVYAEVRRKESKVGGMEARTARQKAANACVTLAAEREVEMVESFSCDGSAHGAPKGCECVVTLAARREVE